MPSWGEIGREIASLNPSQVPAGASPFDVVRRKYLAQMHGLTGRSTIVYATKWTMPSVGAVVHPDMLSITANDIHGFMEAVYGLANRDLDLIIHSPGGSAEAAEAMVLYLRSKFDHIRVFVPHMAMSAATMVACAADQIVMGNHSFIGPIDPQLQLQTAFGARIVAAQAIIQQFEMAKAESADPVKMRAWLPMLSQYGPDLLATCINASELSKTLVRDWLTKFMFKSDPDGAQKARDIAAWLGSHDVFKTHGRPLSRTVAQQHQLNIVELESSQALQDAVLSIYHAVAHTLAGTGAVKVIENHLGKAHLQMVQTMRSERLRSSSPEGRSRHSRDCRLATCHGGRPAPPFGSPQYGKTRWVRRAAEEQGMRTSTGTVTGLRWITVTLYSILRSRSYCDP
jgi:Serine dehydrogenase proteinase